MEWEATFFLTVFYVNFTARNFMVTDGVVSSFYIDFYIKTIPTKCLTCNTPPEEIRQLILNIPRKASDELYRNITHGLRLHELLVHRYKKLFCGETGHEIRRSESRPFPQRSSLPAHCTRQSFPREGMQIRRLFTAFL